jgi:uncharacterized membrane protein
MSKSTATFVCPTCGHARPKSQRVSAARLRQSIVERLQQKHPDWDSSFTCRTDVHRTRIQLLRETIEGQRGTIGKLDASVLDRMAQEELVAKNLALPQTDVGGRVADAVASFGGSWRFLGIFALIILVWMGCNAVLLSHPFDPYPFILLNLVLSCLAAMQAPIIMMSQNRQAIKDRLRAEHDYEINLKAELELQLLHEKLDHLLLVEWQQLLEIQATQTEMLEELSGTEEREAPQSSRAD